MSILNQYKPETGVVFQEFDPQAFIDSVLGGGGATATPKATSTPSPGSRTAQIGGDWYVIDLNTGQAISPAYNTKSEAMYAAQYLFPATPVPTSTPTATPAPTAATGSLDPGLYSQDMLAMADVGAGPTAAVQSGGMGAIGGTAAAPPPATGAAPPSGTAGAKGSTTGSTGATSAGAPAVPSQYAALLDMFTGFSDKEVVDAYYKGEITRDDLAALITLRNTNEKTGETKYTTASLERYLKGVDDAKPPPRKQNALDVLGERFGNISNQYNVKDPQFGAPGAFGSSTAGPGIESQNLYTAQSGGQGLIPMSTPGGNTGLAATVVDNQLYPNLPATDQYLYSGSPASILQQSGVYVAPNTSPATQMQALGNLIALREFFMTQNPSLSPTQANALAVGTMQPTNPNHDTSAGALASFADAPPPMQNFARGGGMTLDEPIMGWGMKSNRPRFMAAEAGMKEKVQPWKGGLKFTPTDKPIRDPMDLPVGIPVEGRQQGGRAAPQMLTLMRMLGIPSFATGGMYPTPTRTTATGDNDSFPRWNVGTNYNSPGLEGFTPNTFLQALQSDLQSRQTDARQGELNQYTGALNDVAGISNAGRLERQQQAYDYRYGLAGMNTPIKMQAPITGEMGQLPPGMQWQVETPAERLSRLFNLNEQQRGLDLSRLQSPSLEMLADLKEAIDDRDVGDIAELLGIPRNQVEAIIRATQTLNGQQQQSGGGGTIGGGWGGGFGGGF